MMESKSRSHIYRRRHREPLWESTTPSGRRKNDGVHGVIKSIRMAGATTQWSGRRDITLAKRVLAIESHRRSHRPRTLSDLAIHGIILLEAPAGYWIVDFLDTWINNPLRCKTAFIGTTVVDMTKETLT